MDRENYWVRKAAEIGETIEAKFYCTYLSGDWSVKGPLTGVLFFSKSTLYFQSFHSSKSLSTLFQLRREDGISESHTFQMPLKDIRCTFNESSKNFWSSLFAEPEQPFVIHLTDAERETASYRFSVDRKKLKTIVNLINSKRSGVQGSRLIGSSSGHFGGEIGNDSENQ
ncbi:MAG: hypothetical protein GY850_39245 [bacterium]|nr:hypothetical protein [bacterium]